MKASFISMLSVTVMVCSGLGDEVAKNTSTVTPEMTAVIASDRAYEEAYAKADIEALAAFFTEDVEYTAEDGRVFSGNATVKQVLGDALKANKGAKLSINVDSVKPVSPDVLVERGSTTLVSKTGDVVEALFSAIHIKKDGKWKIAQVIETPMPVLTPSERLAELNWLIGEWEESDKDAGVTIESRYSSARGGNFITRNVTVKRGDDPILEGWQIIGWDPVEEGIRSWTFDDAGGYSEGRWTHEGQRWLARETGYAPDGSRTSADQTITKVGDDRFYWESGNRTVDGDPLPAIGRIEIRRVKGE